MTIQGYTGSLQGFGQGGGGAGGGEDFAATLVLGNTSGGRDVVLSSGDVLCFVEADPSPEVKQAARTSDALTAPLRLKGQDALFTAVAFTTGGSVEIVPGKNALAGGFDGELRVRHPDEGVNHYVAVRHTAFNGVLESMVGPLQLRSNVGLVQLFSSGGGLAQLEMNNPIRYDHASGGTPQIGVKAAIFDTVTVSMRVKGEDALAAATVNQDGSDVDLVPGKNATGGGTDGVVSVLHPDEAAGDRVTIEHDATDGRIESKSGSLDIGATTSNTRFTDGAGGLTGFPVLSTFTVATLPAAATTGRLAFVSDETGGATVAFDDGAAWRRVQDRAVVS